MSTRRDGAAPARNRAARATAEVDLQVSERAASWTDVWTDVEGVAARPLTSARALLMPLAASWLCHAALAVLIHSRTLRVYDAGLLPQSETLRHLIYILAPNALLTAPRDSWLGIATLILYVAVVLATIGAWVWGVRRAVEARHASPRVLLCFTAVLAAPLLLWTGMLSDDVYLYHLYGKTIAIHGENPMELPPSAFGHDPHLPWVYWRDLPSSYGPVWLALSAPISALAGGSITAAVLLYRAFALALHLATAAAIWSLLRRTRSPGEAAAGLVFYAWNPLVLIEIVGNAHNDVLVALFGVLLVTAAAHRAWSSAAFFGGCAVMVKPFAVVVLPALLLRMLHATRGAARVRHVLTAVATGALTIAALNLPLWAGTTLLDNIRDNPAAHIYTNTLWELVSEVGPRWFGRTTVDLQYPYLDALRTACILVGALWILTREWAARRVAPAALAFWLLFCLTTPWVWPWYFVPAIAFGAMTGGSGLACAAALTAGGLLFWTTWPPQVSPFFERLHFWRGLVLFGPIVAVLASRRVRLAVSRVFAPPPAIDRPGRPAGDPLRRDRPDDSPAAA